MNDNNNYLKKNENESTPVYHARLSKIFGNTSREHNLQYLATDKSLLLNKVFNPVASHQLYACIKNIKKMVDDKNLSQICLYYLDENSSLTQRKIVIAHLKFPIMHDGERYTAFAASIWHNPIKAENLPAKVLAQAVENGEVDRQSSNVPWSRETHRKTAIQRLCKSPIFIKLEKNILDNFTEFGTEDKSYPSELVGAYIRTKGVRYGCSSATLNTTFELY